MDLPCTKSVILYYCREQYYNAMLEACKDAIGKFTDDLTLSLYHAIALVLCYRTQDGINQLQNLKGESVKLAANIALMYANKLKGITDKEVYHKLDAQAREYRKSASSTELYNAASVLFMLKKYTKSLDYIEKSLNLEPSSFESLVLKGWILLYLSRINSQKRETISHIFEKALQGDIRYLDASLGLCESHIHENNFDAAINEVNKAVVHHPSTELPLIYKLRLQFTMQEWDLAIETMNRIISTNSKCLEAMQINILILLCRDANYEEASACIHKFCEEIERIEPRNSSLLVINAQIFSRICGRNLNVLTESYKMVEKALQVSASSADIINELGNQCLLQGKVKEALKLYKSSTKVNDSSIDALMGLTLCELIQNGASEQIRQQVEFLLELQESSSPLLIYIQSKLAGDSYSALKFLNEAIDKHLAVAKNYPYSATYLKVLNPDFLLDIVQTYLQHVAHSVGFASKMQKIDMNLIKVLNVLKIITEACPGLQEATFLMAKIQYLNNSTHDAMANLERILSSPNVVCNEAYLLVAQIQVHSNLHDRASQSLEIGLSRDFSIRENPLYHFISGLIEKHRTNLTEAVKCFNTALSLISLKPRNKISKHHKVEDVFEIALSDKASIFVELISTLLQGNKMDEVSKRLQEAMDEFHGTTEEPRIMVLNADYLITSGDVKGAVDILSQVQPSSAGYLEAKMKLADIFLRDKVDRKAYIKCYQEMVDENPSPESYLLLGDAYLEILETEKALNAYRTALKMNPVDIKLMTKMGQALVTTHLFSEAIDFYTENIRNSNDPDIKLQLAELYVKVEEYDKAEMLLVSEVDSEKSKKSDDLVSLQYKTKLLMSLSVIQESSGNLKLALSTLKEARDNENRIKKRTIMEGRVVPENELKRLIDIYSKLADLSIALKDNEQAIQHYKDALFVAPNDLKIMARLAKIYMQMNYLELCQQSCRTILDLDPDNETASLLMADIVFRKVDFDMAIYHFTQLISKQPTNWATFIRFIEIMRRTGNLDDVPKYLQMAESLTAPKDPGLCYCKALHQWYSGNLNSALMNFNNVRQDPVLGQEAIYNMIEICLNPNDEMLGDHFNDFIDSEYSDSRSMALKTAERLLRELKQFSSKATQELKYRLLSNFILLGSKEKLNIERALEDFISLASQEEYKDQIGPILGIATAYTLLKQTQRAKNQLKRVMKNLWTFEDAEYLERCWILLADYYVQSAKYDLASDLLRKVIQYNKMCVKAYELSGLIAEKEQRYKEAANFYDSAWKFSGRTNSAVGYKVAYNYMKSKRYADAIDVCQQVLKVNPEYPKIKKDILDKSMNSLRT